MRKGFTMEIQEYKTATGNSAETLDISVNKLISEGYQPLGNPYLYHREIRGGVAIDMHFYQAMVKVSVEATKAAAFEMARV